MDIRRTRTNSLSEEILITKSNYKKIINSQTKNFIEKYRDYDVCELALKKNLRTEIDFSFAINQIAIRQKHSKKFPTLLRDFYFPSTVSVEQSSSEITAKYKSEIINDFNVSADLTGGLGIDSLYFAKKSAKHIYCEQNTIYCDFFRNNCAATNQNNIEFANQNCEDFIKKCIEQKDFFDVVYIDPSRRDKNNQKKFLLKDLQPDVFILQKYLPQITKKVIIKFSPMLDISTVLKDIDSVREVHIISVENECKELLLVLDFAKDISMNASTVIKYFAVNLIHISDYIADSSKKMYDRNLKIKVEKIELKKNANEKINFTLPQKYIYEPNSSIMKLGFWEDFCHKYSLNKLHQNSHLFTSNELLLDFPGRVFELIAITKYSSKEANNILQNERKANITVRNFPYSVAEIHQKLKLKDGGNYYIFATTIMDNKQTQALRLLITRKITTCKIT